MQDLERATGVGREAIRFYIREGLLPEPHRPARNVAWYDASFIERILLIKRLQQERYLPLMVIKSLLGGEPSPSHAEVRTLLELDGQLSPPLERAQPHPPEKLSHLAKRLGIKAAELRDIRDQGAVEIVTRDGEQWVEGFSVAVAELWAEFRQAGFSAELGFGTDKVAMYMQLVQWLAREELRTFAQNVTGKVDRETARRMAQKGIECTNRLVALLHERALLRYIAEGNIPQAPPPPDQGRAVGE